jgi:hypothetical protein
LKHLIGSILAAALDMVRENRLFGRLTGVFGSFDGYLPTTLWRVVVDQRRLDDEARVACSAMLCHTNLEIL